MDQHTTISDIIHKYFSDFVARNKEAVEEAFAVDFVFHSPHDPQIDMKTYFEKCWPNGENYRRIYIEKLFYQDNEAFVRYECETKTGAKYRTTEFFKIENNKIKEIEVYYGSLPKSV